MPNEWTPLNTLGSVGSDGGSICFDEKIHGKARITIEKKINIQNGMAFFAVTVGVTNWLVNTGYFDKWESALEAAEMIKLVIQVIV